jgi:hypothetical protein
MTLSRSCDKGTFARRQGAGGDEVFGEGFWGRRSKSRKTLSWIASCLCVSWSVSGVQHVVVLFVVV